MRSKILLLLCYALLTATALADPNSTTEPDDKNLRTIQPHTRSAAVNAEHAKLCQEQSGVDITDTVVVKASIDAKDVYICDYPKAKLNKSHVSSISKPYDFFIGLPRGFYDTKGNYGVSTKYSATVIDPDLFNGDVFINSWVVVEDKYDACSTWANFFVKEGTTSAGSLNVLCGDKYNGVASTEAVIGAYEGDPDEENVKTGELMLADNKINVSKDKEMGSVEQPPSCNLPSSFKGNPINMTTGNKYQHEVDIIGSGIYPLYFERSYNSQDGIWQHTYSSKLKYLDDVNVTLVKDDGQALRFFNQDGVIQPSPTNLGTLNKSGSNYIYTSPWNEVSEFNSDGKLVRTVSSTGLVHTISYSGNLVTVKDGFGHSLTITNNAKTQPISVVSSDGQKVEYSYDVSNRLVKVTKNGKSKEYLYEDAKYPSALTGIKDERGIRYVTWGYDGSGRANLSEHAGSKDKVSITYTSNSQTTFTNPLGRKYTYNYKVIDGVKRITSINGAASSLCPAIGSTYEYNTRGLVTLSTDGKGIKTSYEYNDKGQEISKTVGVGKAEALTIKTTWDDRFFNKPKMVTYPDKVITYSYDAKGNQLNQTVQAK